MKIKISITVFLLFTQFNFAQNIFPGPVGVGTTTPQAQLDVIGVIKSYNPLSLGAAINSFQVINDIEGNVGDNTLVNKLWVYRDGTLNNWHNARLHDAISIDNSFTTPHLNTRTWWERDPKDNIQSWGTDNNTYLTINESNIGIGTVTPGSKLTIQASSTGSNGGVRLLGYTYPSDISYWSESQLAMSYNGEFKSLISSIGNSYINAGNLGIGTISPDEKLTVKGKIHTQEVRVDMSGPFVPDYVFANDYKLKTLKEVENYIKENSHLPEIPSAKEIEKNGLMLAEMNMILLKKIEELTLYAIEQQKNTEQLTKIIMEQNKRLEALESTKR